MQREKCVDMLETLHRKREAVMMRGKKMKMVE